MGKRRKNTQEQGKDHFNHLMFQGFIFKSLHQAQWNSDTKPVVQSTEIIFMLLLYTRSTYTLIRAAECPYIISRCTYSEFTH